MEQLAGVEPIIKWEQLEELGIVATAATVDTIIDQQLNIAVTQVIILLGCPLPLDIQKQPTWLLIATPLAAIMYSFEFASRLSAPIVPAYLVVRFHHFRVFGIDGDS